MIRTCIAKATAVAALMLGLTVLLTPAAVAAVPSATAAAAAPAAAAQVASPQTGTWGG
ncbi:hypothetical protein OIE43_21015 [Streptomyces pseudovenezuelae]|uniref:Uncharacterized protein n=1 Tax=Streptomyces pseudovenezuelae TaxID=67350 RepID=A0ABZ1WYJ0_9ACTN|nr:MULTISPECIES: hypothetical protein [Streptomyces]NUP30267.1 hypothetical protein [Streptomycetaceae bacterium]WUA89805.1 hypothetical protein OHO81_21945 [Streptomyces pseudovenezuelae]